METITRHRAALTFPLRNIFCSSLNQNKSHYLISSLWTMTHGDYNIALPFSLTSSIRDKMKGEHMKLSIPRTCNAFWADSSSEALPKTEMKLEKGRWWKLQPLWKTHTENPADSGKTKIAESQPCWLSFCQRAAAAASEIFMQRQQMLRAKHEERHESCSIRSSAVFASYNDQHQTVNKGLRAGQAHGDTSIFPASRDL